MQLRQLTASGIQEALAFVGSAKGSATPVSVPQRLLVDPALSAVASGLEDVEVEPQRFETRRDVVEYLLPRVGERRHLVADHAGIWSWLGLLNFETTLWDRDGRRRAPSNGPEDTVFIFSPEGRRWQRRYRHWLWGAWSLYHVQGAQADFLLDSPLTEFSNLSSRIIGVSRVFHSIGVVPLMLQLYTTGNEQRPRTKDGPGGTEHLLRALLQLERTYDVYGMSPEALMDILPPEFKRWQSVPATR